jgi:hypothetical protein
MQFTDILDIHDSYSPEGSHGDILGDGFLMEFNPVYRNVRAFSEKIGCQYIEAYSEYLLLPFLELPKIVEQKKIPYVPSARLMKDVEKNHPDKFSSDDLPMPPSYHLHEAAHVIAEHFLKEVHLSNPQEKILKAILAESFANTVDAFACIAAGDEVHYFFIKQNSYMHPRKKVMQAMDHLVSSMGFRFTFVLTFFTYVHANFLTKQLSKKFAQELASGAKISAEQKKDIQTVCGIGEKLDPLFRVTTTGNYLKQQGFEGDIQDVLNFPFMKVLDANKAFGKAIEAMGDSIAF